MAIVNGQFIPPELLALFLAITAPGRITQGPDGTIRVKPRAKAPKRRPWENLELAAFLRTATHVADDLDMTLENSPRAKFIYDTTQDLIFGLYDPELFSPARLLDAQTLLSIPGNVPDLNPPPYNYRTLQNMPTVPTYPDGTWSSGLAEYEGETSDLHFWDLRLKWRKLVYLTRDIAKKEGLERCMLRWNTRITIEASNRASKPMLSLNLKFRTIREIGGDLESTEPPIMDKTNLYWRFKIPPSSPPFYNSYQDRRISKPLARLSRTTGTGARIAHVINASPRPMRGRGFNNNTRVFTSFDNDPEVWEINPCLGLLSRPLWRRSDGLTFLVDTNTAELTLTNCPPNQTVLMTVRDTVLITDGHTDYTLCDNNVTPYNTFAFTPGQNYGYRGAYRFNGRFYLSFNGPTTFDRNLWLADDNYAPSLITAAPPIGPPQVLHPDYPFGGAPGYSKTGWYATPNMPYYTNPMNSGANFKLEWWNARTGEYLAMPEGQFWSVVSPAEYGVFRISESGALGFVPWPDAGSGAPPMMWFPRQWATIAQWAPMRHGLYVKLGTGQFGVIDYFGNFTVKPSIVGNGSILNFSICAAAD